jgi:L,D-transpeptidase YcbB
MGIAQTLKPLALIAFLSAHPALAQKVKPKPPENILPPSMTQPVTLPPILPPVAPPITVPIPPSAPPPEPPPPVVLQHWPVGDASALLAAIQRVGSRGLNPADYMPDALQAAIQSRDPLLLDQAANSAFNLLLGDIRDGRTPKAARIQWLVKDTDAADFPLGALMTSALSTHDMEGVIKSVEPVHPEYRVLLSALSAAPATSVSLRNMIRANLDRWRWMPRKLGDKHVRANVPEYMIRVVTFNKTIASYRAIVGKMSSQTPSLIAPAVGIVVHPPWTIPRSLIKEEVGPMIARSPAAARARGYTWTGSGASLSVVQQPGPNAALGQMKIDMPNPDAIFIHDTPGRHLFNNPTPRAYSHGCVRTDRALELGILLGILQSGQEAEDLAAIIKKGKTERVPFKESIQIAITYFTYGTGMDGKVQAFGDIYGRDVPIIASLDKARPPAVVPVVPVLPTETVATVP